jgi:hypothetical protein
MENEDEGEHLASGILVLLGMAACCAGKGNTQLTKLNPKTMPRISAVDERF